MSVATKVLNTHPQLQWLEIEDSDGGVWRYTKGGPAPAGDVVHVGWDFRPPSVLVAKLVRDEKGEALLRQDDPGLPDKIVVDFTEMLVMPGAPMPAGWGQKLEYTN